MNPLDADMAAFVHGKMREYGVNLMLGHSVEGFEQDQNGKGIKVLLKDCEPLHADLVILAIGVTPDTQLARDAGLKLGLKGAILVNERMETSASDIYAAGDAVQVKHFITGEEAVISLAGPANRQGRIAADNICRGNSIYRGSQGSSVIKIFDMTVAATGINENAAEKAGIDYDKVYLSPANHAGYYPGGKLMTMKILFEKNTYKLLGAQIAGYDGVDKRIDVLACAMRGGLTALQLKDLDLAYAPPFSSAKDPVNMAGFMIENIAEGRMKQFHLADLADLSEDKSVTLLDVRTQEEYNEGHADGFVHIPVDELRDRMFEIDSEKPVCVMCQSGLRSYIASRILMQNGFDCFNFSGGYRLYQTVFEDKTASKTASLCGKEL